MIIDSASYDIFYTGLKTEFQKGIEEVSPTSTPFTMKVASATAREAYKWLTHIPGFREIGADAAKIIRNVKNEEFVVVNRKFEDTIEVPIDDIEDDQVAQYSGMAKAIGVQGQLLYDQLVFECLNTGFSTTQTYDGKAWFANDHVVGESVVDNLSTKKLTLANYATVLAQIKQFKVKPDKDSVARPLNPTGKYVLVVGPKNEGTARQILEATDIGATSNIYKNSAELLVCNWLSDEDNWFLINVGLGIKPLILQERKKPVLIEKTPVNSDHAMIWDRLLWSAEARLAAAPTFPWLAIGSTGKDA